MGLNTTSNSDEEIQEYKTDRDDPSGLEIEGSSLWAEGALEHFWNVLSRSMVSQTSDKAIQEFKRQRDDLLGLEAIEPSPWDGSSTKDWVNKLSPATFARIFNREVPQPITAFTATEHRQGDGEVSAAATPENSSPTPHTTEITPSTSTNEPSTSPLPSASQTALTTTETSPLEADANSNTSISPPSSVPNDTPDWMNQPIHLRLIMLGSVRMTVVSNIHPTMARGLPGMLRWVCHHGLLPGGGRTPERLVYLGDYLEDIRSILVHHGFPAQLIRWRCDGNLVPRPRGPEYDPVTGDLRRRRSFSGQ